MNILRCVKCVSSRLERTPRELPFAMIKSFIEDHVILCCPLFFPEGVNAQLEPVSIEKAKPTIYEKCPFGLEILMEDK
jgi:hypothetical protein